MAKLGMIKILKSAALIAMTSWCSVQASAAEDFVTSDDFTIETVADGLDYPWGLTFLPNGDMLVTELSGQLRVIRDGQLIDTPIEGVPPVYRRSQGGLFEVQLHPEFEKNNLVYVIYAHGDPDANGTRVAKATYDGKALNDLEVIFEPNWMKDTALHYGGRMAFLKDGTLTFTVGDGSEYREKAQELSNHLGTVIRINDDGSVPADNPFVGQEGKQPEIWSYGHRNPQGLVYDKQNDILYLNEHGPRGGDEINVIEKGANFGWPIATFGIDYSGALISPYTEYEGTVQPLLQWTPSIAPSAMTLYRGDLFKAWDGDLLVTALAEGSLRRVDLENGKVVGQTVMLEDMQERLRDVKVSPDGSIYILTDGSEGQVLRLTPKS